MRNKSGLLLSAAAVAAVAGSSVGAVMVTPADVITWGGNSQGRSLAAVQPAGLTWAWTNSRSTGVCIDGNGRVYWQGQYAQTPVLGSFSTNNHRALFTATNSTDMAVYDGIYDGGMKDGLTIQSSATVSGVSTTPPRISGNRIGYGVAVLGDGIITSGVGQNNSKFYIGNSMGSSQAAQRSDAITLNDTAGTPTNVLISTDLRGISQQNSEINSSGTMVAWMAVPTAAGSGDPLAGQFVTTANAVSPAPRGNTAFLATKTVGGAYEVIAQGGQAAAGVPGAFYQNGGNGINGFFAKINRNGQVAFDGKLVTSFPVTTGSDDVAYIHTPGVGTTLVRREGQPAPDASGMPDAGGALYSGSLGNGRGFSNAGYLFTSSLTGGDANAGVNDSGMYLATTTGTTRVFRRNDPVPGQPAGVNFGTVGASNFNLNNSGQISFGTILQGSGVTSNVAYQWNQFGDGLITSTGVQGNVEAIVTGTAGNLQVIARTGMPAPGVDGYYLNVATNNGSLLMNNSGHILFQCDTTAYAPGETIGVVGQTPGASVRPGGPTVLWGWSQAYGLLPMFYTGQQIEVDPGVFKTVSQFNVNNPDNGDGGASGLNDNGTFVVSVAFTDNSWAYVTAQIPAPGTGAIALLGLGVMARRRRK